MLLVGQWILFGLVVCLGLVLLWHAARYVLKLALVLIIAALIVLGLHRCSMLPEPFQSYIDELCSKEVIVEMQQWVQKQMNGDVEEKEIKIEPDINS